MPVDVTKPFISPWDASEPTESSRQRQPTTTLLLATSSISRRMSGEGFGLSAPVVPASRYDDFHPGSSQASTLIVPSSWPLSY